MKQGTKISVITILVITSMIGGCVFLMRGCLSKYDEYYAFDEAQGFKSAKGEFVVFLKEHYKVNSYSSNGGSTNISGTPYYSLETRDASTLKLIKSTEFEKISDPTKNCPRIIGRDDHLIWIFQGKIMAFDALSHEMVCDKEKLEQMNADLKNNLPDEIDYYAYNYILGRLEITTKNAFHFQISGSFKAQRINENAGDEPKEISDLKAVVEKLENERKVSRDNPSNKKFWELHDTIQKVESIIREKEDEFRNIKEYNDKIQKSRKDGFDDCYDQLCNSAISDTVIYALLSDKELKQNSGNFHFARTYMDDVQRLLYQSGCSAIQKSGGFPSKSGCSAIQKSGGFPSSCKTSGLKALNNNISFLNGGFLENKVNLKTIALDNPQSWLIISSKEVGRKSKLIIQRVTTKGIPVWTKELPIINFSDMVLTDSKLLLFSNDGEKISSSDNSNWIFSIDLKNGEFKFLDLGKENE
jgi:hypothetical protein